MDDSAPEQVKSRANSNAFATVPIEVTVSVGKAHPTIHDLLHMERNSILPLDSRVDDPVELFVGDQLIARGELEEMEGKNAGQLAVRLTEIVRRDGNPK